MLFYWRCMATVRHADYSRLAVFKLAQLLSYLMGSGFLTWPWHGGWVFIQFSDSDNLTQSDRSSCWKSDIFIQYDLIPSETVHKYLMQCVHYIHWNGNYLILLIIYARWDCNCSFRLTITALWLLVHSPVGHYYTSTRTIWHCNDSTPVMLRPCDTTSAIQLDYGFFIQANFIGA